MKPDCVAARRAVLLGEVGSGPARDHLGACADCRDFEALEGAIRRLVREQAGRPAASHALRERLVLALESERRKIRDHGGYRWLRRVAVLAALVILGGAATRLHYRQRGFAEARRTVEALAADHIAYATRPEGMEVTSASAPELTDWLRVRTNLAVRLPLLPEASLVGGRRCNVRGRPAALALYRMTPPAEGAALPVSVFAFERGREDWSRMAMVESGGSKRICRAHARGLSVLIWEDRGLTYALVTEMAEPDVEAWVSTF